MLAGQVAVNPAGWARWATGLVVDLVARAALEDLVAEGTAVEAMAPKRDERHRSRSYSLRSPTPAQRWPPDIRGGAASTTPWHACPSWRGRVA